METFRAWCLMFRQGMEGLQLVGNEALKATRTHAMFHFWLLVWQSFVRNRCLMRASSLAYTTLLALIPVLAVAFSVATNLLAKEGEEGQKQVEQIIEYFVATVAPMLDLEVKAETPVITAESEEGRVVTSEEALTGSPAASGGVSRRTEVARTISEYINNINAKTIGVTSVLAFILMAVLLFRSIEATFNDIWGVKKGRGWFASLVQYWTSLTLGPILLILAIGFSSSTHFSRSLEWVRDRGALGTLVLFGISWFLYSIACGVLYKVMPKTVVHLRSALIGGIVAGFLLQLNNKLSFLYLSNVANADRIYGSLGAAPMLLLGLYISWTILLFGAQAAYAFQNYESYRQEKLTDRIHHAGREFLALRVMTVITERFLGNGPAPRIHDLASRLGVASGLTGEVVEQLEENCLIREIQGEANGYLPARPPADITVDDVLMAIRRGRGIGVVGSDDGMREEIRSVYDEVEAAGEVVGRQRSLADLANKALTLRPAGPAGGEPA